MSGSDESDRAASTNQDRRTEPEQGDRRKTFDVSSGAAAVTSRLFGVSALTAAASVDRAAMEQAVKALHVVDETLDALLDNARQGLDGPGQAYSEPVSSRRVIETAESWRRHLGKVQEQARELAAPMEWATKAYQASEDFAVDALARVNEALGGGRADRSGG